MYNYNLYNPRNFSFLFYVNNSSYRIRFPYKVKNFSGLKRLYYLSGQTQKPLIARDFYIDWLTTRERNRVIDFELSELNLNTYKHNIQNNNSLTLRLKLYNPYENDTLYTNLQDYILGSIMHVCISENDTDFYEILTFEIKDYDITDGVLSLFCFNNLAEIFDKDIPETDVSFFSDLANQTNVSLFYPKNKPINIYYHHYDGDKLSSIEFNQAQKYDRYTYFNSGGTLYFSRVNPTDYPRVNRKTILSEYLLKTSLFVNTGNAAYPIFAENLDLYSSIPGIPPQTGNIWNNQFPVGVIERNNFYYLLVNNRIQRNNDREFYESLPSEYNLVNFSIRNSDNIKIANNLIESCRFDLTYFYHFKYFYFKDFRFSTDGTYPKKLFIDACKTGCFNNTDVIQLIQNKSILFDFSDIKHQITEYINYKFEDGYTYNLAQIMLVLGIMRSNTSISPRLRLTIFLDDGSQYDMIFNQPPISNASSSEVNELFLTIPEYNNIKHIRILNESSNVIVNVTHIYFLCVFFPSIGLKNYNLATNFIPKKNNIKTLNYKILTNTLNVEILGDTKDTIKKIYDDIIRPEDNYHFFAYLPVSTNAMTRINVFRGLDYYTNGRLVNHNFAQNSDCLIKRAIEKILIHDVGFRFFRFDTNLFTLYKNSQSTSMWIDIVSEFQRINFKNIYDGTIYCLVKLFVTQNESYNINNYALLGCQKGNWMPSRVFTFDDTDSKIISQITNNNIAYFGYKYIDKYTLDAVSFNYGNLKNKNTYGFYIATEYPLIQINQKIKLSEFFKNLLFETGYSLTCGTRYKLVNKNINLAESDYIIPITVLYDDSLIFIDGKPQIKFYKTKNNSCRKIIFNACFNKINNEPNLVFSVDPISGIDIIKQHDLDYISNINLLWSYEKDNIKNYFDLTSNEEIVYNIQYMRPESYINIIKNLIGERRTVELIVTMNYSTINLELGDIISLSISNQILPNEYNYRNYLVTYIKYDFDNYIMKLRLEEII